MKFYVYILNIQIQLYEKRLCSCKKISDSLQRASVPDSSYVLEYINT